MAAEACTDDATCPRGRQAEAAATCPGRRSAEARWGRGMLAGGRAEIWTPERNESLEGFIAADIAASWAQAPLSPRAGWWLEPPIARWSG